jgi:hypothetical protein
VFVVKLRKNPSISFFQWLHVKLIKISRIVLKQQKGNKFQDQKNNTKIKKMKNKNKN